MTAAIARKHDAETDTYECTSCSELKPRADFTKHRHCLYGLQPVCRNCSRLKSQKRWAETREAQRAKRAALAPVAVTPKPAPKPAPRPFVQPAPKAPIDFPMDDPARCVHGGASCDVETAAAIVSELFAAKLCMGVVRGVLATVAHDATGMAHPRFVREATRDLWNSIVRNRCGRRDEVAA